MENMPISMVINDFKERVETAIRESRLPPVLMEPIMSSYAYQLRELSRDQILSDARAYSESKAEGVG